MMSLLLSMVFLMPLCFMGEFWLVQFMFFIYFFIFLKNFSFNYFFNYLSLFLGLDMLSFFLVLLSFWICALMVLASEKIFKTNEYYNLFLMVMLILMISLYITFSSMNLLIFYLFFEISLIPTLILIIGWGYQPERVEAGMYLLFYTLLFSLPMMISIFYYYSNSYSLEFFLFKNLDITYLYVFMIMIFMVKMPMFFIHLWLPKAHVEAPVAGSMILAGIMLKLGGYGLCRLMVMFVSVGMKYNIIFMVISLVGGLIVSFICMRQSDMKSLIAYSSVAHMGMVLSGIMTMNFWGMWGALVMMLAHGLCSSGLFCLANISYERLHSRNLYLNKGLLNIMPSLSLWWFLFSSSNMAAPPSLNLLGEIMLINSLVSFSWLTMIFLSLMSFFSAVYSLFLFSFSQHGKLNSSNYSFYMGYVREYLLLFLHWFPLNVLILKSEYFIWI
ncbi:NADH dehydrogenase subunit 4 (mitochondrion) [Aethina tumida]|uniref:NADH-ubiquinone oxidoreductase chain 4 n=1 Tax=Aethina tumida TaxID=116153 RepID=A0A343KHV2_AETTU|nr:NADH dehydrogenase subunit 4 [Aethina tumida]ATG28322.1 NADH dehydrogenase subunit 4 [Aethina tumida]